MKTKLSLAVLLLAGLSLGAHAQERASGRSGGEGSSGRGGAEIQLTDEAVLEKLLDDKQNFLKKAMIHYLETISVSEIQDPAAKRFFREAPGIHVLKEDILRSEYRSGESCRDAYDKKVAASAGIGQRGGAICFDVKQIADDFKTLPSEKAMIKLAAIAMHEHVHHFQTGPLPDYLQSPAEDVVARNEAEAYSVAAYVELTAKSGYVQVLEWDPSGAGAIGSPSVPNPLFFSTWFQKCAPVGNGDYRSLRLKFSDNWSSRGGRVSGQEFIYADEGCKDRKERTAVYGDFIQSATPGIYELDLEFGNVHENKYFHRGILKIAGPDIVVELERDYGYKPQNPRKGARYPKEFSERAVSLRRIEVTKDTEWKSSCSSAEKVGLYKQKYKVFFTMEMTISRHDHHFLVLRQYSDSKCQVRMGLPVTNPVQIEEKETTAAGTEIWLRAPNLLGGFGSPEPYRFLINLRGDQMASHPEEAASGRELQGVVLSRMLHPGGIQ